MKKNELGVIFTDAIRYFGIDKITPQKKAAMNSKTAFNPFRGRVENHDYNTRHKTTLLYILSPIMPIAIILKAYLLPLSKATTTMVRFV